MKSKWFAGVLLVAVLAVAFFDRYLGLTIIGMEGSDATEYWEVAKHWFEGDRSLTRAYRPLTFGLYEWSFHLFGVTDSSIKFLNFGLDLGTIGMLMGICYFLTRNLWFVLAAAAVYALNPYAIHYARNEIPHPAGGFFITSYAISVLLWLRYQSQNWLLLVAGLLLGCAANTHPDLGFAGLGVGLLLVWLAYRKQVNLWPAVFLVLGFAATFIFVFNVWSYAEFRESMSTNADVHKTDFWKGLGRVPKLLEISLYYATSKPFAWIFFLASIAYYRWACVTKAVASHSYRLMPVALDMLMFSHVLLHAVLAGRHMAPRVFFPFAPLVILSFLLKFYLVLPHLKPKGKAWAIWVFAALIVFAVASERHYRTDWRVAKYQVPHPFRYMYDVAKDLATEDRRVLLMPMTLYHDRPAVLSEAYLGDRAVYMLKTPVAANLRQLIEREKIAYVFFSKKLLDRRVPRVHSWGRGHFRERLKVYFGLRHDEYSAEEVRKRFLASLVDLQPQQISSTDYGDLYALSARIGQGSK